MKKILVSFIAVMTSVSAFAMSVETRICYKNVLMKVTADLDLGERALNNINLTSASGSHKVFGIAASSNAAILKTIGARLCATVGDELHRLNAKYTEKYEVSMVDTGGYNSNIHASGLLEVNFSAEQQQSAATLVENDENTFRGVRCSVVE